MNIKTISKILIGISAVIIYMAMSMDTTVSTGFGQVHNIGLQNDKTNMLILGGVGFIAGIILFATGKVKQTKQEEEDEKNAAKARISAAKSVVSGPASSIHDWWQGLDNIIARVTIFFILTFNIFLLTTLISDYFGSINFIINSVGETIFLITTFVIGIYLLFPRPAAKLITNLLFANIVAWGIFVIINLIKYLDNGDQDYIKIALLSILVILISTGIIRFFRNARKKVSI